MQNFSGNDSQELFPLSLLSQYGYCKRRCALLALEEIWQENEYTAAGRIQHEHVHTVRTERRGKDIYFFEMAVFSRKMGVRGLCDCVEAHFSQNGAVLPSEVGYYSFYPVEYKHGIVRDEEEYHLQLCAQAICLEEQFHTQIPAGAIFFIDAHRRDEVVFSEELRNKTWKTAKAIADLIEKQQIVPAFYSGKCKKCSLQEICRPKMKHSARSYSEELWREVTKGEV